MSRGGRPRAATPAQVEQVRSLAAEGVSERKIAEVVFGYARYRGRVERILRRRDAAPTRDLPAEHAHAIGDEAALDEPELPSSRELLNRHRRRLAHASDLPSLTEIALLLKLERQVEAQETVERLKALTREVD